MARTVYKREVKDGERLRLPCLKTRSTVPLRISEGSPSEQPDNVELLNVAEAVRFLAVSPSTLSIATRRIPVRHTGRLHSVDSSCSGTNHLACKGLHMGLLRRGRIWWIDYFDMDRRRVRESSKVALSCSSGMAASSEKYAREENALSDFLSVVASDVGNVFRRPAVDCAGKAYFDLPSRDCRSG
jgi:hypothetical protein